MCLITDTVFYEVSLEVLILRVLKVSLSLKTFERKSMEIIHSHTITMKESFSTAYSNLKISILMARKIKISKFKVTSKIEKL